MSKNKFFQGKDSFCRMNFLYQASMLMAGKSDTLSAYYGNLCRNIGKKSVLQMDPDIKRTLCKKCGMALKPGITSATSASDECNREVFSIKCLKCGFTKNYIINPEYTFWLENPASYSDGTTPVPAPEEAPKPKKAKKRKKKEKPAVP